MLIDDRCLGARATKGRSRREDQLEIVVSLLITQNTLGRLQQAAEFDEGRHPITPWGLKHLSADPPKTQGTQTSLIRNSH